MTRLTIILPAIDYGADDLLQYPALSNDYKSTVLPDKFYRWGTQKDAPFHCFVDDWRIEAIWRNKYKAIDKALMSRFAVLPDYTIETDSPLVHAIYQVWRSRTIGRYWQDHGVFCIPALQWSRPAINHYLFDGLASCDVVAVRSPTKGFLQEWLFCASQFLEFHQPKLVLHFGTKLGLDVWPSAINLNLR